MAVTTVHPYITSDSALLGGEPLVRGTKTPVRAIVELWRLGIPPEEIPEHLPHIALAQVFDALSYYAEHQAEINHFVEINRVPDDLVHPASASKIVADAEDFVRCVRQVLEASETGRDTPNGTA